MRPTITDSLGYVFVYGTLRKGQERDINRLQPAPIFIGNSQILGTLYDLGSYPGVRLDGAHCVEGEVYQITPELECQLDEIEEVWPQQTGEYTRQMVAVPFHGAVLTCLVYEVAQARISGRVVVLSGDWILYDADR
jgi:gamma-glutamylcyclotransferase (GGCT)/AIG2-like uncharacterized protein YtfP